MLFSRRAALTCASYSSSRVRHELMGISAVKRTAIISSDTLLSKSMSGTSPPTAPALSPSNCQWRRGRPVTSSYGNYRSSYNNSVPHRTRIMRYSIDSGPSVTRDVSHGAPTIACSTKVEPRLWTSSQGIRFAPPLKPQSTLTSAPKEQNSELCTGDVDSVGIAKDGGEERPREVFRVGSSHTNGRKADDNNTTAEHFCSQESTSSMAPSDSKYTPSQDDVAAKEADKEQDLHEAAEDEEEEMEEHIPLDYQIPETALRTAMAASPDTRASFWGTKLYKGPKDEAVLTHYCKTIEIAERVAKYFLDEKVLGFDIEWRPHSSPKSIKQNASLIQLASENRVALFHIALFDGKTPEELLPPTLRTILQSPEILKVGVAVKGDFSRLQKYLNIQPQGIFELSRLHNLVEWYAVDSRKVTRKLVGLAVQVLQHLQLPLYKGGQLRDDSEDTSNVRESDWSKSLNHQQIYYAAGDAYAGFRLYHMLEWKRKQLRPTPPSPDLCDYDAKPKPKAKLPTKKTKSTSKSRNVAGSDDAPEAPTEVDSRDAEEVNEEDADDYETAAEDVMDSHELEDPETEIRAQQPRNAKRVGRVISSFLQGPDPAYPQLPEEPYETSKEPVEASDMANEDVQEDAQALGPAGTRIPGMEDATNDDEFADPELEEALKLLTLDEEGKVIDTNDSSLTTPNEHVLDSRLGTMDGNTSGITNSAPNYQTRQAPDPMISDSEDESSTFPSPPTSEPLITGPGSPHSTEYEQATTWAQTYLKSTVPAVGSSTPSRIRATVAHLRAYHLWHEQKLSLDDIAAHLRDPPLSLNTVTGYILQAVTLEKLAYDNSAMKTVVSAMPATLRKGRWKWMAEKMGVS